MTRIRFAQKTFCPASYRAYRPCSSHFMDVSRENSKLVRKTTGMSTCTDKPNQWHYPMRRALHLSSGVGIQYHNAGHSVIYSSEPPFKGFIMKDKLHSRQILFPFSASAMLIRSYSSNTGSKHGAVVDEVSTSATVGGPSFHDSNAAGNNWPEFLNQAYQSISDASSKTVKMVKEATDELIPHINQTIDSQPYFKDVIVPVGGTLTATLLAWLVMPRLLRKLHKYSVGSPLALLLRSSSEEQISYEKSLWSALEDPARYVVTFLALSQLAGLIVPSISIYLSQAWRGAVVLSFVWFLQRWKANVIARALSSQATTGIDREKLLAVDKISSVGLLAIGIMGFSEACGVAVQSILTVGGIGGVATAFAAKDILGNVLNGISLQFSKPFSIGDSIKAGSIEGQVVDIGITTTSLINAEKFPVTVPNSLFSSQVIVNKSRAQWRALISKIPIRISDVDKIPHVSEGIKSMLRSHPKVFLEKEPPYCYLSRIENSYAELTVGCNLISMRKDEFYSTEQDILLEAVKIIKTHGGELGSTLCDFSNQ